METFALVVVIGMFCALGAMALDATRYPKSK
jgi:hypothetical protein